MFIGMGSSVVWLEALILFQKLRGLLIFAASSLACSSAIALRFFVRSGSCTLSLLSSSCLVLQCSQDVIACVWLRAWPLSSCFYILHRTRNFSERVLLCVYSVSVSRLNMGELWSGVGCETRNILVSVKLKCEVWELLFESISVEEVFQFIY